MALDFKQLSELLAAIAANNITELTLKNAEFEPDFKVTIFDRYGKLVYSFPSRSNGWDGMYNNQQAVST